jgi:hypothetical protein
MSEVHFRGHQVRGLFQRPFQRLDRAVGPFDRGAVVVSRGEDVGQTGIGSSEADRDFLDARMVADKRFQNLDSFTVL